MHDFCKKVADHVSKWVCTDQQNMTVVLLIFDTCDKALQLLCRSVNVYGYLSVAVISNANVSRSYQQLSDVGPMYVCYLGENSSECKKVIYK